MKPRHTIEQSTVRVNKAEAMGKRGFSAVMQAASGMPAAETAGSSTSAAAVFASVAEGPKATAAVASFVGAPTMDVREAVAHTATAAGSRTIRTEQNPDARGAQQQAAQKKESHIMPPSDPQADLVCDSCQ